MNSHSRKYLGILIIIVLGLVAWTAPTTTEVLPALAAPMSDGMECEELVVIDSVTSATLVNAGEVVEGQTAPVNFCRVIGKLNGKGKPADNINYEVWLPEKADWNNRLNVHGNGALAGSIGYPDLARAVGANYATASTDTGHQAPAIFGWWALDDEGNLDEGLLEDWAHYAHYLTTVAAKNIIEAYYGQGPSYSYFTGCSGGGGHGLQMAQKYPDLFDGIEVGAPANFQTHMWPGEMYASIATHDDWSTCGNCAAAEECGQVICGDALEPDGEPCPSFIPFAKLPYIRDAAVAACDALDGIEDGLINDPRKCDFDPYSMVCAPGEDAIDCLTPNQVASVKRVYAGLWDPFTGEQIWPGYEPGSEYGWAGHVGEPFYIPISYFKYFVYENADWETPQWDWHTFIRNEEFFEEIARGHDKIAPIIAAIDPDLSDFKASGGKIIMWHGWDDQNIAPRNSINYYESVEEAMGNKGKRVKIDDFFRLFMVPGMQHCSGGPGPASFDALGALVQWVEEGKAPDQIIGTNPDSGLTRPLCPYPSVAVWNGKGSPDDVDNFKCKKPKD